MKNLVSSNSQQFKRRVTNDAVKADDEVEMTLDEVLLAVKNESTAVCQGIEEEASWFFLVFWFFFSQ